MGNVELCFLQIPGLYGKFCELNLFNADPTTARWYAAFRWITVAWVSCLFLISGGALIYSRWQKRKQERGAVAEKNQLVSSVQDLMLGVICAASLDTFLYHTIDPGPGFVGVMPPVIAQIFFSLQLSFLAAIFAILIFHWIEIYLRTVNVLKREEMLTKVNSNYEPNVTLQDITTKVSSLTRIKIPMIAITILTFLVSIGQAITLQSPTATPYAKKTFMTFWGVYFFIVYGIESLGFVIIGNYMVTILPPYLQKRMKAITLKFSILALLYLFVFIFTWVMFTFYVGVSQPWVYLISDLIGFWVLEAVVSVVLSRFVTFVPRYPFFQMVGMGQTSASGKSGERSGDKSGKSGTEVGIEMSTADDNFDDIPNNSSEV